MRNDSPSATSNPYRLLRYRVLVKVGMNARQARLDALRSLREEENRSVYGWVVSSQVPPGLQQSLQSAADQGLVELADRVIRAELSAHEGRPVL